MEHPYYFSWTKQKNVSSFEMEKVSGVKFYTPDNKDIIDFSSISYQAHFGYNHPKIIQKITEQLQKVPIASPKAIFQNKDQNTYSLIKLLGHRSGKIFYTTGGAETIENALKIARDITKKKLVLARSQSYHGATMGALSVTGDWRNPPHQLPNDWVVRIPEPTIPNSLEITREIIKNHGAENFAAFILETITGGNGVIIPSQEWWDGIQKICKEFNILLILDEVVCGFNRTGKAFGFHHYNIEADMICMAKGITGGMIPFGALWTNQKISEHYDEHVLCCGLTNYAHPLGLAAMEGVLEILCDIKFLSHQRHIENLFKQELDNLKSLSIVKEIRSIGHLAAVDLHKTVEWKKFFESGLYLVSQNNRIILAPPLIMTEEELKEAFLRLNHVLKRN